MKKILITTSSFNLTNFAELSRLQDGGIQVITNPYKRRLNEEEITELLNEDVIGMIAGVEPLTRNVLASAPNLKIIARCGIGLDNVDLDAAHEFGIQVSNTPDAPTQPVAELTIAHMLNLLRKVSFADKLVKGKQWQPLMGELLSGKTVGIIGLGRIGKKVAELAGAFGALIVAYDTSRITHSAVEIEAVSLNALLSASDIVTIHTPFNPETKYLIGEEQLGLMKTGAYLLNISRGGLVDEKALFAALKDNRLAGAGLDTFEEEPYFGPLGDLDNVLLTSHMGSYAKESRVIQEREAAVNLVAAMKNLNILN